MQRKKLRDYNQKGSLCCFKFSPPAPQFLLRLLSGAYSLVSVHRRMYEQRRMAGEDTGHGDRMQRKKLRDYDQKGSLCCFKFSPPAPQFLLRLLRGAHSLVGVHRTMYEQRRMAGEAGHGDSPNFFLLVCCLNFLHQCLNSFFSL